MGILEKGIDIPQSIHKVCHLFDSMPQRNAIISYNDFQDMHKLDLTKILSTHSKENSTTFTSILHAHAEVVALEQVIDIHQRTRINEFCDVVVGTSLVDKIANCGSIDKARELLEAHISN